MTFQIRRVACDQLYTLSQTDTSAHAEVQKPNQFLLGVILTAQLPLWSPTSIMRGVNQRYVIQRGWRSDCTPPVKPMWVLETKGLLLPTQHPGSSCFLPSRTPPGFLSTILTPTLLSLIGESLRLFEPVPWVEVTLLSSCVLLPQL